MTCGLSLIAYAVASAWDVVLCPWHLLCRALQATAQAYLCLPSHSRFTSLVICEAGTQLCLCFLPVCHQVWIYVCLSQALGNSVPESQDTKKKRNKTYCTEKCVCVCVCGVVQTCKCLDLCSRPPMIGFLPS